MRRLVLSVLLLALIAVLNADEIRIAFALVPPYVMQDADNSFSGLEYEIVKAALAAKGHMLKPVVYPLARLIETVKIGQVDAAARILPSHETGRHLSDVYIYFSNVAIGLQRKNLAIASISDLSGTRMVAFQRATLALGPEFLAATKASEYTEVANQTVQILMLFNDRVDLAIGDSKILHYLIRDPKTGVDGSTPVVEHRIFPETPYRVAFVNQRYMQDFNAGLAIIKANGVYDAISAKY